MKETVERHLIQACPFKPGTNEGVALCTCGWWGASGTFAAHRREAGAKGTANGYPTRSQHSYDQAVYNGSL